MFSIKNINYKEDKILQCCHGNQPIFRKLFGLSFNKVLKMKLSIKLYLNLLRICSLLILLFFPKTWEISQLNFYFFRWCKRQLPRTKKKTCLAGFKHAAVRVGTPRVFSSQWFFFIFFLVLRDNSNTFSIENWIPLNPVLACVRDVARFHYFSWADSIKPSLQF